MTETPLTILSVNSADLGGGAERIARELHQAYRAAGEHSWFAVGQKRGGDPYTVAIPNRARRSAWARGWMRAADALPQRSAGFWIARGMRDMIAEPVRWIARQRGHEDFDQPGTADLLALPGTRPDALHLHNLHGGYFDLRALPGLTRQVPTVLSLHDAWLLSGHCAHGFDCDRWVSGCGACPALWIHPAIPRDGTAFNWERKRDIFARSALHVATPCVWLADRVRRSMLMPAVRELRVIPYGVDLELFRPADKRAVRRELGLDPDRPVLLTFANSLRARTWKDSDAFRGALDRLTAPATDAQWIAVGESGPDEQVGGVRIRRVGTVADDRAFARWYQAADVYIHPARADTFPLMVLESLACGTPVIGTAVGGVPEQIVSGGGISGARQQAGLAEATGAVVEGGDPERLALAIAGFLALDPAERATLAANAARDARLRFDSHRHVRDYHDWIRTLAAEPAPALSPD